MVSLRKSVPAADLIMIRRDLAQKYPYSDSAYKTGRRGTRRAPVGFLFGLRFGLDGQAGQISPSAECFVTTEPSPLWLRDGRDAILERFVIGKHCFPAM